MKFILLTKFTSKDRDEEVLRAHREWLLPRYADGTFIFSGGFDSFVSGPDGELAALALLQAPSFEDAKSIVDSEPFFVGGYCTQELHEFLPRVRAADLNAAFGDDLIIVPRA